MPKPEGLVPEADPAAVDDVIMGCAMPTELKI
jgi:hypothetical protein